MSNYVKTDRESILDTECSTVACLGRLRRLDLARQAPVELVPVHGRRGPGAQVLRLADVLFSPRYLRDVSGPAESLIDVSPAQAARACRRLANILENEPESLQATGPEDRHDFERRLTEALWGDDEETEPTVARFDCRGVHSFPDGSPFCQRCGRHRNRI